MAGRDPLPRRADGHIDQSGPGGRRRPLAVQGLINGIVRGLSRTPLLAGLVGRGLITLYVVGRKSGRRYTVPMAYVPHEGSLLLGSGFAWAKNLRTGEPLEVRFKGKRRVADVRILTDEAAVTEHYAVIARRNPGFARLNHLRYNRNGEPEPDDLRAAWADGARVILLTIR